MIFNYFPVLIRGSRRHLPFVTVQVLNRTAGKEVDVFALVDSGSEHNIFHIDFAKRLGLSLVDGEPVVWGGYGDGELAGVLLEVDMQIQLGTESHRWRGPVIFSEEARKRQVLGQEGFFEYFDVSFRRAKREFEIRKVVDHIKSI